MSISRALIFSSFIVLLMAIGCNRAQQGQRRIDAVISYAVKKSNDSLCTHWNTPPADSLQEILASMIEITGTQWHDCYGDWSCGASGKINVNGVGCTFRLDAGGVVILNCGDQQQFLGCGSNQDCWKWFPSENFCDPAAGKGLTDSVVLKVCDLPVSESSEGGTIKGYFLRSKLIRMQVEQFAETGKLVEHFDDVQDASFGFEQRYLFYDKPIYQEGFVVVDSVLLTGRSVHGRMEYQVSGSRFSKQEVDRSINQLSARVRKYSILIDSCASD